MKNLSLLLLLVFFSFASCNDKSGKKHGTEKQGLVNREELTAEFETWWNYHYHKIALISDFVALDEDSEVISKKAFLIKLATGDYIAIEGNVKNEGDSISYKLIELPETADDAIATAIKNSAETALGYHLMEGQKFPKIELTAINGQEYNNESLVGKITVIKTWFIACKPCIAEMPELNEFVHKYSSDSEIQFLSLATDTQASLEDFLKKRRFDYVVFPEQKELIQGQLNLSLYPTHLVVDKNGEIKKIFNKASELMAYIEMINPF